MNEVNVAISLSICLSVCLSHYLSINAIKLPWPLDIVQELSMVVAIVIRTVGFRVIRWRQGGHFVSIYGVTTEKVLHFVCHLMIQMSNQILSSYNM